MRKILLQLIPVFFLLFTSGYSHAAAPAPAAGGHLFTNGPVLQIQISLDDRAINSLRENHREDVFGTLVEGGKVYQNVAFHLKGAAGSLRMIDDGKPAFTVSFNKKDKNQRFHGLRKIHLNNSVQDPVYIDEQFCGELFRAAGVPAARTAHAAVSLNGRKLGGLYVLKESFSNEFLAQYFSKTDGNLYDGGFITDIDQPIEKSNGKGVDDHSDLKAVVKALREGDQATRWKKLNQLVDVDRFISMMALEAITVHWDGYSAKANNYRVYVNPENGKLVFFVHGMDQMFGRMSDLYAPLFPFMGGIVARTIVSTREGKALYEERTKQVFARHFQPAEIQKMLVRMRAPVEEELKKNPSRFARYRQERDDHQSRVMERIRFVSEQLQKGRYYPPRFENGCAVIDYWVAGAAFKDLDKLKMVKVGTNWQMSIEPDSSEQLGWRSRLQLEKGKYRLEAVSPGTGPNGSRKLKALLAGKDIATLSTNTSATTNKTTIEFLVPNPRNEIELIAGAGEPHTGVTYDVGSFKLTKME